MPPLPSDDAASQYALNGAAVELVDLSEYSSQPPAGERHCQALFTTVCVRNLKLSTHSTTAPSFPVVHNQLLCLADVEGEVVVLAPHCQTSDLLPKGCLIVSDQS